MSLTAVSLAPAAAVPPWPEAEACDAGRLSFDATLSLRHAGRRRLRLACEWQGAAGLPVVVVLGGISAHRHLAAGEAYAEAGWWEAQVGAGRALDPSKHRLLSLDWIGADGALDVAIDSADQADAIAAVLDRLGIARVAAVVGASYGAMVGLQFAARHGDRLGALVAISGGDRAHPYAQAWRALQRRILALGASEGGRREALSLARQLAMLSYRTPEEFAARFDAPPVWDEGHARFASEDYLRHCGERYVARTPALAFERLSESIDTHAVDAASVRTPTTLVAVREDRLVPAESLIELAGRLPQLRRLHVLRSLYGHDAFLKEDAAIDRVLREAMAGVAA